MDLGEVVVMKEAEPVGEKENYDQATRFVNSVVKNIRATEGLDGNEGGGGDSERTVTDDVLDGPAEDLTQVTQHEKEAGGKGIGKASEHVSEEVGVSEKDSGGKESETVGDPEKDAVAEDGGKKEKTPKQTRKNPTRNAKAVVKDPYTDEKSKKMRSLRKVTKNTSCKEMSEFLKWYSDKRFASAHSINKYEAVLNLYSYMSGI